MEQGCSFLWPAGCKPMMCLPSGKLVQLEVHHFIPYLKSSGDDDDLVCTCYPTLAPSPAPTEITTTRPSIAPTEQGQFLYMVLSQDYLQNVSLSEDAMQILTNEILNAYKSLHPSVSQLFLFHCSQQCLLGRKHTHKKYLK